METYLAELKTDKQIVCFKSKEKKNQTNKNSPFVFPFECRSNLQDVGV